MLRWIFLRITLVLVVMGLLAGCSSTASTIQPVSDGTPNSTSLSPSPGADLVATATLSSTPTGTHPANEVLPSSSPAAVDTPSPTPITGSPIRYELVATLDYYQHSLSASEIISYVNTSSEDLTGLLLVVEPNRWEGSFSLDSLTWGTGNDVTDYGFQQDQLSIPLPVPLKPGESLVLQIEYTLEIPQIAPPSEATRPQPYGYSSRQTNIVDWYPYIPPYRAGAGWSVNPHWWFGENQVYDVADFSVRLSIAEPIPDLVVAASAPALMDGAAYTYHLASARTFALSASDQYQVETTTLGGVDVHSYFFPYDTYSGQEVLHNTADAMQLFSRLLTPYPYPSLSVVQADFLDGMEYSGLFFLSNGFYNLYDGTPQGYLTFIAAHETAHQWWYGVVGNDQALQPWLDEALCTYMEHVFYENVYADYSTGSSQSMLDWWWYYRVNFYNPTGWVDGTIYDYDRFLAYRDSVYLNGANFLEELRLLMGDEAFFSFLRDYAQQNSSRVASSADFFTILESHTDADLTGLLGKYFQNAP